MTPCDKCAHATSCNRQSSGCAALDLYLSGACANRWVHAQRLPSSAPQALAYAPAPTPQELARIRVAAFQAQADRSGGDGLRRIGEHDARHRFSAVAAGRVIDGKVVTLEEFNAHIKAQREASEP